MKRKRKINKFKLFISILIFISFNLLLITKVSDYMYSSASASTNKLILVNKKNEVEKDYVPKDMVKIKARTTPNITKEETYMVKVAADALERMFAEAEDEGVHLYALSGYRSYSTQAGIYERNLEAKGLDYTSKYVAQPGQSEHQTGLAMDITNETYSLNSNETIEGSWLEKNAHKFGFILRYQEGKEDITGYNYEPWHFRYIGKKEAKEIFEENITLEEYVKR